MASKKGINTGSGGVVNKSNAAAAAASSSTRAAAAPATTAAGGGTSVEHTTIYKQGPLKKQGGGLGAFKMWKMRWFVLHAGGLSYYASEQAYKNGRRELGFLAYDENFAIRSQDEADEPFLRIVSTHRSAVVRAPSMDVKDEWINILGRMRHDMGDAHVNAPTRTTTVLARSLSSRTAAGGGGADTTTAAAATRPGGRKEELGSSSRGRSAAKEPKSLTVTDQRLSGESLGDGRGSGSAATAAARGGAGGATAVDDYEAGNGIDIDEQMANESTFRRTKTVPARNLLRTDALLTVEQLDGGTMDRSASFDMAAAGRGRGNSVAPPPSVADLQEDPKIRAEVVAEWGLDGEDVDGRRANSRSLREGFLLRKMEQAKILAYARRKQGKKQKEIWKKFYFIFSPGKIELFNQPFDRRPIGRIPVDEKTITIKFGKAPSSFCFCGFGTSAEPKLQKSGITLRALNSRVREAWCRALEQHSPVSVEWPAGYQRMAKKDIGVELHSQLLKEMLDGKVVGKALKRQQEFVNFCESVFSEENVKFYLQVEKFKEVPKAERRVEAFRIFRNFLRPGGSQEIASTEEMRSEIERAIGPVPEEDEKEEDVDAIAEKAAKGGDSGGDGGVSGATALLNVPAKGRGVATVSAATREAALLPPLEGVNAFDAAQQYVFQIMLAEALPQYLESDGTGVVRSLAEWQESRIEVATAETLLKELFAVPVVSGNADKRKKVDVSFRRAFLLNHRAVLGPKKAKKGSDKGSSVLLSRICKELRKGGPVTSKETGDVSVVLSRIEAKALALSVLVDWMEGHPNDFFDGDRQKTVIAELTQMLKKLSGISMSKMVSTDPREEALKWWVVQVSNALEQANCLEFVSLEPLERPKEVAKDQNIKRSNEGTAAFLMPSGYLGDGVDIVHNTGDLLSRSDVCQYAVSALAKSITKLDFSMFEAIAPVEFLNKQWTRGDNYERSPNIMRMAEKFNRTSYWVATEVLSREVAVERGRVIRHFIELADALLKMHNFYSLFAIINGLSLTCVARLKSDWARLPRATQVDFERLSKTVCKDYKNYRHYRKIFKESMGRPQIPHILVTCKDCFGLEEISTHDNDGNINFHKFTKQYAQLSDVFSCQQCPYNIADDAKVLQLCVVLGVLSENVLPEKKLYERSLRFLPRK